MVNCPDCHTKMKPSPPYYVCPKCGLSIHKLEIEKAYRRRRKEREANRIKSEEDMREERKRAQRDYLNWLLKRE